MSTVRVNRLSVLDDTFGIDVKDIASAGALAGTGGAELVGTSSGKTQQELNDEQALLNASIVPKAGTVYYVTSTGSDSNAGTSAKPFLTLQKAVDSILARAVFSSVTINVGAGTFAGFVVNANLPYGTSIDVVGAGTGSTTINSSINVAGGANVSVDKVRLNNSTSFPLWARKRSRIVFKGISFGATTAVSHVLAESGGVVESGGVPYAVTAASANFHLWARGSGSLIDVQNTRCDISNVPNFQFFVYFAEGATVYANGWTYTGSTTGGRYVVTSNAVCIAGTTTAAERDAFWPGDHGNTDTSTVDQPNVGGRFDGYPDYGFSTLQTIDATGLSTIEFNKIPDCFTQIILKWDGLNMAVDGATFAVQFKPAGQTAYNTSTDFYQKTDIANTTVSHPATNSALDVRGKIAGGGDAYGNIVFHGFHGGAYPTWTGCYTDNANLFHSVQGIFLDPNWLRNIRLVSTNGTFAKGTVKLLAVY